ncbi:MAG: class I SAM-dependent methyltransferase [Bryobacterales bacterium]|nr:class I SAM-dependent methyltransferase [Bryobacterales bacterium]
MPANNAPFDEHRRDAFVESTLAAAGGAMRLFSIYLGDRLGYYQALADGRAVTAEELARSVQADARCTREWLEQQTVNGIVEVDDAALPAEQRRFRLPAEHAEPLADADSLNFIAPLAQVFVGAVEPLEQVVDAFRTGRGVPFEDYGREMREGQARINRTMFLQQLGQEWIPAMPDVAVRLAADPPARIADIGCGCGWSAIGMAQAFPKATVDGFDLDEASVEDARANVAAAGLSDRVRVQAVDCGDPSLAGTYDLVVALECIHDMADPVAVLRSMRRMVAQGGAVLVADERVAESFEPGGGEIDWLMYGWSVFHCLHVGMTESPSRCTGTVMRPSTFEGYAREAGFAAVEVLPVENLFFRLYRLLA